MVTEMEQRVCSMVTGEALILVVLRGQLCHDA